MKHLFGRLHKVLLMIFFFVLTSLVNGQSTTPDWKPVNGPIMTKWAADVNPENVWSEYPRPQLVREKWMSLNGLWDFAIRPKEENIPAAFDGKILVPFSIESALSGVAKTVGEKNLLWYKRTFDIPKDWKAKNIIIHFEAVDWEMKVWINGKYVNQHNGGYDHAAFDITKYLKKSGKQEVVVSVWDPTDTGTQPRGKQVQKPQGIWYTSVTGIWQSVWLEPLAPTNIESVYVLPNIDQNYVQFYAAVCNEAKSFSVEVIVLDGAKKISDTNGKVKDSLKLNVPNAKLWTPDSPFLYNMKIYLKNKRGIKVDSVLSYFGMRKTSLAKDENGITRMMLNNKFVFQYGPLDQGWWPDGLYTAPTDEALRFDVEMTKGMGFNLARKHVKVEPDRWYYWCDKLGLLVWQDMPSGDKYVKKKDEHDIERTEASSQQLIKEMKELIKEKFNHPSIVMWVPYNEGWGQWNSEGIVKLFQEQDPTRLVDHASGWCDRKIGSVNDMHNYPAPDMPVLEKERAVVLGEFGGLGLPLDGHTWQSKNNWGYRNLKSRDTLAIQYEAMIDKLKELKNKGLSAAVYTQTTDVENEVNGLMTYDRKIIKIDPGVISKINLKMWR